MLFRKISLTLHSWHMKTWVHDCHSTVSQPAIHKSSKTEKSSKNDVSRTNSNYIKFLLWDFGEEQRFSHKLWLYKVPQWEACSKNRHQNRKTSSIQTRACVGSVTQLHEWLHVALVYRVMRRKVMPTDSHNYWPMVSDSIQSHDVVDETWKEKRTYKTGNERWK